MGTIPPAPPRPMFADFSILFHPLLCYCVHFHRVSFPMLAVHNHQDGSLDPNSRWACQYEARDFDFGIDWMCRVAYSLDEVRDLDALRVGEMPYQYFYATRFLGSFYEEKRCTLDGLARGVGTTSLVCTGCTTSKTYWGHHRHVSSPHCSSSSFEQRFLA